MTFGKANKIKYGPANKSREANISSCMQVVFNFESNVNPHKKQVKL